MRKSVELFDHIDIDKTIRDFEYTRIAKNRLNGVLNSEEFKEMDSEKIYEYLTENKDFVSFKDYLKRYIYLHAGIEEPFSSITDDMYKRIIRDSFRETRTPMSFNPTTKKPGAIISGWLSQDSVRRSTVFLIGFGLHMSDKDVGDFLTKVLKEEDFNFDRPEEVIYWYCFRNGFGYLLAADLVTYYKTIEPGEEYRSIKPDDLISMTDIKLHEKEGLMKYLECLKANDADAEKGTAYDSFVDLVQSAKERIAAYYQEDYDSVKSKKTWTAEDINSSDLERWICSGIPTTKGGELQKASASKLGKLFGNKRMSRHRMDDLLKKKVAVDRFDLITMSFFNIAVEEIDDAAERYRIFVERTNTILENCKMAGLYVANPYEAFVLLCLLTDGPLSVYADIWEMSYLDEGV